MSFQNGWRGPDIVSDRLVLYLDAGSPNSYRPDFGTTWKDMSGFNNSGSLVNGPTYSSANGGSIVFDGIDDNAITMPVSNISTSSMEGSITYEYWVQPTQQVNESLSQAVSGVNFFSPGTANGLSANINYKYCFTPSECPTSDTHCGFAFAFGTNGFIAGVHQYNYAPPILVDYKTFAGISHLVVIKTSNNCSYYVNGVFQKTSSTISRIIGDGLGYAVSSSGEISPSTNTIVSNSSLYFAKYFKGNVYSYKLYLKELNQSEILQNFNAQKSRFGL